jgi:hypothetical protein
MYIMQLKSECFVKITSVIYFSIFRLSLMQLYCTEKNVLKTLRYVNEHFFRGQRTELVFASVTS